MIVSAIGTTPSLATTVKPDSDTADRLLLDSVAQGLVRFDATGQIVPGIAERWIVTDEGSTYIFRLREMNWADGQPMRASEVVAALRRRIAPRADNPLAPYLTAIDSIVEMTPQVIQVELTRPRPELLKLFAQPELAIVRLKRPTGSGPLQVLGALRRLTRLTPVTTADPDGSDVADPTPEDDVLLVAERASAAVLRFVTRKSDLVAGGDIGNWPLVTTAGATPDSIRIDPAAGLFGLAIVRREGFLATPENRAAVAVAIDRAGLAAAVAPGWQMTEDVVPGTLDSAAPPARAAWTGIAAQDRRGAARAQVIAWRAAQVPEEGARTGAAPVLRVALPPGPGGTLLWGRIAADLYAIGIQPRRVQYDEAAELRLIDGVAPYDSARWYLATACQPCGEAATAAIEAARVAPTLTERARAIAIADAALAADVAFVPIARPFRWSLVSQRLRAWAPNERAWHPLNALRRDTK